ncbi:hypothetical protein BGP_1397 [Beggiatoa sp. PS]|nr:hypothetical protein BGP_1397 [Beggiatoa sp. PS]
MARAARLLFQLKGKKTDDSKLQNFADKLADEYITDLKLPIPTKLTEGIQCYYASILVQRNHLPNGVLSGSLFPLIVHPKETDAVMILPSRYWPEWFIENVWLKNVKEAQSDLKKPIQSKGNDVDRKEKILLSEPEQFLIKTVIGACLNDVVSKTTFTESQKIMRQLDNEWSHLADALDLVLTEHRDLALMGEQEPLQAQILEIILQGISDLETIKTLLSPEMYHSLKWIKDSQDDEVLKHCATHFGKHQDVLVFLLEDISKLIIG